MGCAGFALDVGVSADAAMVCRRCRRIDSLSRLRRALELNLTLPKLVLLVLLLVPSLRRLRFCFDFLARSLLLLLLFLCRAGRDRGHVPQRGVLQRPQRFHHHLQHGEHVRP